MAFHDLLGNAGVAVIVVFYFLLQIDRMDARKPLFSIGNAVGAAFILVSLAEDFNLSAVLMEGFWLAISLYGLARALWFRPAAR